jgi:pyrimidine operon attenuation protein / uracil phosphoribosyltransferase
MEIHQPEGKIILDARKMELTIERLCWELIENHGDFRDTCLVGIQPRGTMLAKKIHQVLSSLLPASSIPLGWVDITFFRDDIREKGNSLLPNSTEFDFSIEKKKVVLIDDVLFSGRTVQAALVAIQNFGRPSKVELLVLVDRKFNRHIPIRPDVVGILLDALDQAYVKVEWEGYDQCVEDRVLLYPGK